MEKEMLMQSVPNFSEGRDLEKIDQIVDCFRARPGVKLLDYATDPEMNRCVVTVVGQPEPLKEAVLRAMGRAVACIDMTAHEGHHPRIGAVDVVPFIPVRGCTIDDADDVARAVAREAAQRFSLPCYLYEHSASAPYRMDVSDIRRGQFEGLGKKMLDPMWKPDFGPDTMHPTAGAAIIGARMPLIFFNVNLDTPNVELAKKIALRVRGMTGGLRYVKAMGIAHADQNLAQVTMNLTDYTKSALYTVFEIIKMEARRYGVHVLSSEIAGMVPVQALVDSAAYYLQLEDLTDDQILENMFD